VLKYFGCELGAQTNFDKKTGLSIVNGAHDSNKLSEILEGFIKKFVQCYSCGNPETHIKIKKELLYLKCKVCCSTSHLVVSSVGDASRAVKKQSHQNASASATWVSCALMWYVLPCALRRQCWAHCVFVACILSQACGFVSDVDPRHKLNTFILKNPPENKMTKEEKK
jgi:hypothetical protein